MYRTSCRNSTTAPAGCQNQRGAVLLLSVYLISFTLLLLCAAALQRTTTEVRAAETSRDQQQAFWAAEAALDSAITSLRVSSFGTPDELGCWYGTVRFDGSTTGATTKQHSDYMLCQTSNPAQYTLELRGQDLYGRSIWISTLLDKQDQTFTMKQAILGLNGITVANATVGGVNTTTTPIALNAAGLAIDGFGNYVTPSITAFNNQGNLATASAAAGAISIRDGAKVYGEVAGRSDSAVSIASDSTHGDTHQTLADAALLATIVPVSTPASAAQLGSAFTGTSTVSPSTVSH